MMLETNPGRIEVGVFDHLDDSGRELGRQYNDRLEIAAACDRSGFRGYHHFLIHVCGVGSSLSKSRPGKRHA